MSSPNLAPPVRSSSRRSVHAYLSIILYPSINLLYIGINIGDEGASRPA